MVENTADSLNCEVAPSGYFYLKVHGLERPLPGCKMPDVGLLSGAGEIPSSSIALVVKPSCWRTEWKHFCVLELFSFAHVGRLSAFKVLFAIDYVIGF